MKRFALLLTLPLFLALTHVAEAKVQAICSVDCGGGTVLTCGHDTNSCSASNRNCDDGVRGNIMCDGVVTQCPISCGNGGGGGGGGGGGTGSQPLNVYLTCGTIGLETHCSVTRIGGTNCGEPEWSYFGQSELWLPDGNHAELWLPSNCSPNHINTVGVTIACDDSVQTKYENITCDPGTPGGGGLGF